MTTALAIALAVVFGVLGVAKLAAVPPMRTAAGHLGFTVGQYRVLGALELAGAVGVLVGLVWTPIGVAAAIGLGLLLLGAAAAHVAHRDPFPRVAVPLLVAAAGGAYLLLLL